MDERALTSLESRLLPLLTTTLSLNEIAQALRISPDDVLALMESIYSKLGLTDEETGPPT